jgi:cytochrome P450
MLSEESMVTAPAFNPFTPGFLADPYPTYRALLRENPVSWEPMMEMWIFTRYKDVEAILTHARRTSVPSAAPPPC